MREEFESWWYASKYCQVVTPSTNAEQIAWDAWRASREAVEIELPSPMPSAGQAWNAEAQAVENTRVSSFNSALRQSKRAIEDAGLKVKPC